MECYLLTLVSQKKLDISHNNISDFPKNVVELLPLLQTLNISYNNLQDIPQEILVLQDLDITNNPLLKVIPAYRNNKTKVSIHDPNILIILILYHQVLEYLQLLYTQQTQSWNQIKLMLVGQEVIFSSSYIKIIIAKTEFIRE